MGIWNIAVELVSSAKFCRVKFGYSKLRNHWSDTRTCISKVAVFFGSGNEYFSSDWISLSLPS
jgi:hypothetical protein